ncbi:MAG TPA: NUDIX domain-containing protein [Alphaproteobacteria bacterium]|jgi:8-oxo-dGTP pyrophosphatase MutT (NUDIX family)|nr:NUDIX domain-containing protein [Alphaproteobacteria bacterium]
MNTKPNQQISIGVALVFRDFHGKRQWFLVKQKEGDEWELPKVTVRKGESSVRSVIRLTGEQAGMTVRVLEEAGRTSSSVVVNNKSIPQKTYYYLMVQKSGGLDPIGFSDFQWLEYGQALKKVILKKDKEIFADAKVILKEWEKTHKKQLDEPEEEELDESSLQEELSTEATNG